MAQKHEIELYLSENGELKVHIKGIKGPTCGTLLDGLAKELGNETARLHTAEYYEQENKQTITKNTHIKR